jgi:hypothetical protein
MEIEKCKVGGLSPESWWGRSQERVPLYNLGGEVVGLGFEFRALCLKSSMSHTSDLLCSGYFGDWGVCGLSHEVFIGLYPGLAFHLDPPNLSLPSSWE